jgi:two-component system nitrate/nitrite response regulator NarL
MPPTLQLVRNIQPSRVPATLRVVVAGGDALARSALVTVLSPFDDIELAIGGDADAVLFDQAQTDDLPRGGAPVLALVRDRDAAADALARGARGALLQPATPSRIRAALHAVADGLVAFDDHVADSVLPHARAKVDLIEPLTARELEVLHLLAAGLANKAIATQLGISGHTVKFHVNGILGKLGVDSRTEAVVQAARLGIVSF